MDTPLLQLRGLAKRYGTTPVFADVDLTVTAGRELQIVSMEVG
jgi:ABC-type transporter Mla maintaining outer membrane lipid asymmetry ATPase subunit MlaF